MLAIYSMKMRAFFAQSITMLPFLRLFSWLILFYYCRFINATGPCPHPAKSIGNRCVCKEPTPSCFGPLCSRFTNSKNIQLEGFPVECSLCKCDHRMDPFVIQVNRMTLVEFPRPVPKLPKDQVCLVFSRLPFSPSKAWTSSAFFR